MRSFCDNGHRDERDRGFQHDHVAQRGEPGTGEAEHANPGPIFRFSWGGHVRTSSR